MDFEDITTPIRHGLSSAGDFFLILGAIALVTGSLLVGVILARKRRRRHHHHHHHAHHAEAEASPAEVSAMAVPENGEQRASGRRRRRRRRREHRPRNPTLAETGGLPPAHPDKSIEP